MPRLLARRLTALLAVAWLAAAAAPAWAGQMVVRMSAQAWAWEDRLEISLEVTNQGDETGINLQAQALGLPGAKPSQLVEGLPRGQSVRLEMVAPLPPGPPGRYALPLRLDLQDLAQFPYSAMGHFNYSVGPDRSNPLAMAAEPVEMSQRGQVTVLLTNTEDRDIALDWRVYAPRELMVDPAPRRLEIPARATRQVSFQVDNLTGVSQAEYPLLVWTGYELDGARLEKIGEARVRLVRLPGFFQRTLGWWLALGGLLAAWVAWVQFRSRRRR